MPIPLVFAAGKYPALIFKLKLSETSNLFVVADLKSSNIVMQTSTFVEATLTATKKFQVIQFLQMNFQLFVSKSEHSILTFIETRRSQIGNQS